MSNPNPSPEPVPAISASELRRRLLASAPPGAGAPAAELPEVEAVPELQPPAGWTGNSQHDLLARLKMPGKSGPVPVPTPRPTGPSVPLVDPTPTRSPVNRRTPTPGGRLDPAAAIAGALNQLAGFDSLHGRYHHDDLPHAEVQRLRAENKELRTLLEEMKHLLQEASDTEQRLVAKEKEFEEALAAKDAQIEELSTQLGAIEEQIAKGELAPPPPVPKTRTELEEWADELEKESAKTQQERKRLDRDRQQLREDEEALEKQMREMEVAMARERALIARQETELRRLSAEIQHELELVQRGDATLREHMAKFQRRAQEVMNKPPGGGTGGRR
jgi:predicted  nucleic acid-binding Zn-ribbon protein